VLSTVSCDCSQTGLSSSACFESAVAIPTAQGKPCSDSSSVINYPAGSLIFNNNSVSYGCVDVLVSQVSALRFQVTF
jgi:hypothetical protein